MKHSLSAKIGFFMAAVLLAMGFASCSDDNNDLPQKPDMDFVKSLQNSTETITYTYSGFRMYDMPTGQTEWKWKNTVGLLGFGIDAPYRIIFHKGKIWTELDMVTGAGPSQFYELWRAYRIVTHQMDKKIYLAEEINLDPKGETITLDLKNYEVLKFKKSGIALSYETTYFGGEGGQGGKIMEWIFWDPAANTVNVESDDIISFANRCDAYDYIIKCCREKIGNEVNLATYNLSSGTINLDEAESKVKLLRERNGL